MPNGRVGAEVRLDGQNWAIVRSFNPSGGDWALANTTLHETSMTEPATGMEPFKQAATGALLGAAVQLMPRFVDDASAWPAVLAWLTRDQECRFAHLLDWRDKDSDSNSPVRGRSIDDRLMIVRAVLGALTAEELVTGTAREAEAQLASRLRTAVGRLDWQAGRWWSELASSLGFSSEQLPSELDAAAFTTTAEERLAQASGVEKGSDTRKLDAAQAEEDRLEAQERAADLALASRRIEIGEREKLVKFLRDELPQLSANAATVPLCSACKTPIGDVHHCDTTAQTAELKRRQEDYQRQNASLSDLRSSESGLQYALALASQRRKQQRGTLDGLRKAALNRSVDVRRAQQLVADAHRYRQLLLERQTTADQLDQAEAEQQRLTTTLEEHRAAVSSLVRELSARCNVIAHQLIPGDVSAWATLDGTGLRLHVNKGGDNTATAIESLKVVIFDLAVLSLSIEGRTYFPGLLLHDSPREADLDVSIYHRLFGLVQKMEQSGSAPLFQYVITSTTKPPDALVDGEWLRLTLHGAPASERLLRTDL